MIKLPKPSSLSMRGSANERFDYLIAYLSKLVDELERLISGVKKSAVNENVLVADITADNDYLIIRYTNGSIKKIQKG